MRTRFRRLVLLGIFALLLGVTAFAADILLNSDFRDGKTHWQGGGQAPTNMGGKLVVALDPKKWTVLYQHFATRASTLKLTIVYSLSSDCTVLVHNTGEGSMFTSDNLVDACGLHDDFSDLRFTPGDVGIAFTVCGGGMMSLDYIQPTTTGAYGYAPPSLSRRTYTGTLTRYWGNFDNDEFCLAFPPGEGTITLLKVTLTKIGN